MITCPYLLVLNVPLHRHDGSFWADPLWRKDLEAHLVGIADLAIACPVESGAPPPNWERLSRREIIVHPLPAMRRWSWLAMPFLAARLWKAVSRATIVHTGVAGWPFPLGWIAVPIARLRRRFVVVVVESAFWRIPPGVRGSALSRARAWLFEGLNRACIRQCDISFFTTDAYRHTLHPGAGGSGHVLPAIWVDDEQVIDEETLVRHWPVKGTRMLFAGRLTAGKGLPLLLEAVKASGVAVDVIGEGELRDAVIATQRERPDLIRLLDPVDYGAPFFRLLDDYAALVVPTVTDEQPRVIYDAFARGLAVIASDTTGNRQILADQTGGLLFAMGDSHALAATLSRAAADPAVLRDKGLAALRTMATRTHAAMHAKRAEIVAAALAAEQEPEITRRPD